MASRKTLLTSAATLSNATSATDAMAIIGHNGGPALMPSGTPGAAWSLESILTEGEHAQFRRVSVRTVQRERLAGEGVPYLAISGRKIGYRFGDILDYLASRRRTSTSAATVARGRQDRAA